MAMSYPDIFPLPLAPRRVLIVRLLKLILLIRLAELLRRGQAARREVQEDGIAVVVQVREERVESTTY